MIRVRFFPNGGVEIAPPDQRVGHVTEDLGVITWSSTGSFRASTWRRTNGRVCIPRLQCRNVSIWPRGLPESASAPASAHPSSGEKTL